MKYSACLVMVLLMAGSCGAVGPGEEIERLIRERGAEVGIAFETLDGEFSFFRDEEVSFHAASTMKVPVMIELFRQTEQGRLNLGDSITVVNEFRSIVDGSPYQMEIEEDSDTEIYDAIGEDRTLRQLCEAMITVSSNLATNLLIEKLGVENIRKTVEDLGGQGMHVLRGVEDGKAYRQGLSNSTTAKGFFVLLKRIALGEAAGKESCREMVGILKRQQFNEGVPSGLPEGTPVGHKTGQITRIHHDGGIVYAERPFVLVILVRGIEDDKVSAQLMGDITRVLYRWSQ